MQLRSYRPLPRFVPGVVSSAPGDPSVRFACALAAGVASRWVLLATFLCLWPFLGFVLSFLFFWRFFAVLRCFSLSSLLPPGDRFVV